MYFHVCGNCTRTAAGEKNNIKLHPKQEIIMEFEKHHLVVAKILCDIQMVLFFLFVKYPKYKMTRKVVKMY